MSTDYNTKEPISANELLDGRLKKFRVREHTNKETDEHHRMLTDGNNYLHVWVSNDGNVESFTRFFPNGDPSRILAAIYEEFDVEIFSEYEPQYWGFELKRRSTRHMRRCRRSTTRKPSLS